MEFNFGKNNSSFINLKSIAAFYYQKLSEASTSTQEGNVLKDVGVKLMKQSQQLCMALFGGSSKQYLDILLDVSRLYSRFDLNTSVTYLEEAKKVCQINPQLFTPENLLSLLSYET